MFFLTSDMFNHPLAPNASRIHSFVYLYKIECLDLQSDFNIE